MRRIAVVTTSRADYSHLFWVLRDLEDDPRFELHLIVSGAHLDEGFGRTLEQIRADGLPVAETVACLDEGDDDLAMARTIGAGLLGLAEVLARLRPDLLLLIADRYELLAPAAAATALRIPIAHIEGGELSEGAIDDQVRHAVTKLAHLHFTPTESARRRVLALGEEPWRVHRTGAPSLDHLRRSPRSSPEALERTIGLPPGVRPVVVAVHPVTVARDTLREAEATFAALDRIAGEGRPIHFCFPNADAGGRALIERARAFCERQPDAVLHVNLAPVAYWGLLERAALMVGNSSSGIMEAPALELPVVNVGLRQQGRERAANIVDAPPEADAILAAARRALEPAFRERLRGMHNPYGDGRAAERIVGVLADCPLGEALRLKRALAL